MKDLLLLGAGGHATSCIDVIEAAGSFRIVGLVGTKEELHLRRCGYEIIAVDEDIPKLVQKYRHAIVAVGQIKSATQRTHLYHLARQAGLVLPAIVSPTASVSRHAEIGAGSIVMHGAIVNANAKIGANCIINSRALVEHDTEISDHCHISTGAIVNGNVRIGHSSFVGSGSVTKHGVSIGSNCLVGMGSIIRHDLPSGSTFMSNASNG